MIRWLEIILTGIVTSLFLFPFNLPFASAVNTKMLVALAGLICFVFDMAQQKGFWVSKQFFILSLICIIVSLWALVSTTVNNTYDNAFVTYFVSVWVWLGGAYAVVWLIRAVHKDISVELIGRYMVCVCVIQCILAYIMTLSPSIKSFIDSLMGESESFMGIAEGRIYGLGAALDPSGLRFSAVLVILAYLIPNTDFKNDTLVGFLYIISFFIISVIGNMIARATTIGLAISVLYWLFLVFSGKTIPNPGAMWGISALVLIIGIGLSFLLYHTSPAFHDNLRFGFEGFFSIFEKGRWETHSTDILKTMIVWPETVKTWIIGDGYFTNPDFFPNIFGQTSESYYMRTDIGYLRYIFYFGVIGLLGMITVFTHITVTCCKAFKNDSILFFFLLLVNLTGWVKVSSDIIMVFAPFLVMAYMTAHEGPNEEIASN
ncbi:MAG: hypothetical protein J5639_00550 [Bacteroidales bacterium]|nr:hypothetical protein [Bacteroidales bacterium]